MASARYQTIAQGLWPYLGTAFKLLDADLRSVEESSGGGTGSSTVINTTSTTTRPTSETSIVVVWHTPEPPTSLMVGNDCWVPTGA